MAPKMLRYLLLSLALVQLIASHNQDNYYDEEDDYQYDDDDSNPSAQALSKKGHYQYIDEYSDAQALSKKDHFQDDDDYPSAQALSKKDDIMNEGSLVATMYNEGIGYFLSCNDKVLRVALTFQNPFSGYIYSLDRTDKCTNKGSASKVIEMTFDLGKCGVKKNGNLMETTIMVDFENLNPGYKDQNKLLNLSCQIDHAKGLKFRGGDSKSEAVLPERNPNHPQIKNLCSKSGFDLSLQFETKFVGNIYTSTNLGTCAYNSKNNKEIDLVIPYESCGSYKNQYTFNMLVVESTAINAGFKYFYNLGCQPTTQLSIDSIKLPTFSSKVSEKSFICGADKVVVKLTFSTPFNGKIVTVQNQKTCSYIGKGEKKVVFDLNLNECAFTKSGDLISQTLAVDYNNGFTDFIGFECYERKLENITWINQHEYKLKIFPKITYMCLADGIKVNIKFESPFTGFIKSLGSDCDIPVDKGGIINLDLDYTRCGTRKIDNTFLNTLLIGCNGIALSFDVKCKKIIHSMTIYEVNKMLIETKQTVQKAQVYGVCINKGMKIYIKFEAPFSGKIYTVASKTGRIACDITFKNAKAKTVLIPFDRCGTKNEDGLYRNTIIIQSDTYTLWKSVYSFFCKEPEKLPSEIPESVVKKILDGFDTKNFASMGNVINTISVSQPYEANILCIGNEIQVVFQFYKPFSGNIYSNYNVKNSQCTKEIKAKTHVTAGFKLETCATLEDSLYYKYNITLSYSQNELSGGYKLYYSGQCAILKEFPTKNGEFPGNKIGKIPGHKKGGFPGHKKGLPGIKKGEFPGHKKGEFPGQKGKIPKGKIGETPSVNEIPENEGMTESTLPNTTWKGKKTKKTPIKITETKVKTPKIRPDKIKKIKQPHQVEKTLGPDVIEEENETTNIPGWNKAGTPEIVMNGGVETFASPKFNQGTQVPIGGKNKQISNKPSEQVPLDKGVEGLSNQNTLSSPNIDNVEIEKSSSKVLKPSEGLKIVTNRIPSKISHPPGVIPPGNAGENEEINESSLGSALPHHEQITPKIKMSTKVPQKENWAKVKVPNIGGERESNLGSESSQRELTPEMKESTKVPKGNGKKVIGGHDTEGNYMNEGEGGKNYTYTGNAQHTKGREDKISTMTGGIVPGVNQVGTGGVEGEGGVKGNIKIVGGVNSGDMGQQQGGAAGSGDMGTKRHGETGTESETGSRKYKKMWGTGDRPEGFYDINGTDMEGSLNEGENLYERTVEYSESQYVTIPYEKLTPKNNVAYKINCKSNSVALSFMFQKAFVGKIYDVNHTCEKLISKEKILLWEVKHGTCGLNKINNTYKADIIIEYPKDMFKTYVNLMQFYYTCTYGITKKMMEALARPKVTMKCGAQQFQLTLTFLKPFYGNITTEKGLCSTEVLGKTTFSLQYDLLSCGTVKHNDNYTNTLYVRYKTGQVQTSKMYCRVTYFKIKKEISYPRSVETNCREDGFSAKFDLGLVLNLTVNTRGDERVPSCSHNFFNQKKIVADFLYKDCTSIKRNETTSIAIVDLRYQNDAQLRTYTLTCFTKECKEVCPGRLDRISF
ncbi:uncharacterized protein LOC135922728 isoform X2 [Gordionus sp. m RMFG-2023]|uniref:uncharacterized protein LOC135922728 isoform X2 n=1 Tax=Gordionus sp. m RMFG-2023 TaxID=3053472 RepID=UPI0031FC72D0